MNDKSSQLQIRQLSARGELLRAVNCFSGQVTVLRAHVDQDLMPFQRALAGRPGPERFSILLDHDAFSPEANILIGYGEQLPREMKVIDYCLQQGVPEGSLSSIFISYGLDGFEQKSCSDLSECAARRVQLIAATFSAAKVWILNNPFEPISSGWRERFAELILNDTRAKQRIVVVVGLSYRPQAWVGNELINRVQVGESIQKTVGFGAQSNDVNDMVKQLRDILKSEDAVQTFLQSQGRTSSGATATKPTDQTDAPVSPTAVGITSSSAIARPESAAYSSPSRQNQELARTSKIQDWDSLAEGSPSTASTRATPKQSLTTITQTFSRSRFTPSTLALLGLTTTAVVGLGGYLLFSSSSEPDHKVQLAATSELEPFKQGLEVEIEKDKHKKQARLEKNKAKADKAIAPKVEPVVVAKPSTESPSKETPTNPDDVSAKSNQPAAQSETTENTEELTPPAPIEVPPPVEMAKATFVLDNYPPDIKQAILKAFSSRAAVSTSASTRNEVSPKLPSFQSAAQSQKNPFEELKGMKFPDSPSDSSAPPPISRQPQTYAAGDVSQETMEERQARVRQKFMEAINRAIEKREQSGESDN